jgi:hypothetical protein
MEMITEQMHGHKIDKICTLQMHTIFIGVVLINPLNAVTNASSSGGLDIGIGQR